MLPSTRCFRLKKPGGWQNASPADGAFNSAEEAFTFTTATLGGGLHTVEVRAVNSVGNWSSLASDEVTVGLLPDLAPNPVVPASITGTHTLNTLYAGRPTYFDWSFANIGGGAATSVFYVDLLIDSTRHIHYPFSNWGAGWSSTCAALA